jgi:signal transduction histidine kinase
MKSLKFRTRISLWCTVVVLLAVIGCGCIASWVGHTMNQGQLESELADEATHVFREIELHGGLQNLNKEALAFEMQEWMPQRLRGWVAELWQGEKLFFRSSKLESVGLREPPRLLSEVICKGEKLRVYHVEKNNIQLSIGYSLRDLYQETWDSTMAWLMGLPVALVFSWLGGNRIARLAVKPVTEMTQAMQDVTAAKLDQRVPVPPMADELQAHAATLNTTLDRLQLSYQQALRFSADASHELKTPLTIMRAGIEELLSSSTLDDENREGVAELLTQNRRITDITSTLLLLARADAGFLKLALVATDIIPLVQGCVEDSQIAAEAYQTEVSCELPEKQIAVVDPNRFSQILSNLLDNALKYGPPSGKVRVYAAPASEENFWAIAVENEGPGIPPELQPRLFDRFYRASHHQKRPGSGLGLSISRELARAHGGDLRLLKSEPGSTVFCFYFQKAELGGAAS